MKKTLWTLNIDGYAPELTQITYPFLWGYARKIGADFRIINERRFPGAPPVYEKLQIFELGQGNDWNIYVDSDALIFPDMFDVTERVHKDTVVHYARDFAGNRWRYDRFFRRDGRDIGSCNWFTVASDWCLDLWHPLDGLSFATAAQKIQPTVKERLAGITAEHLIDDYVLSRNIARFGLKFTTVQQIQKDAGDPGQYFWHRHTVGLAQKVLEARELARVWAMNGLAEQDFTADFKPEDWLAHFGLSRTVAGNTYDPEINDVRVQEFHGDRAAGR